MSIFDFFKWNVEHKESGPNIKFGRYSDAFKEEAKYALYEESVSRFEDGDRLKSISFLLDFLRDDRMDNVQYDTEGDELFFELLQGSKRIIGRFNSKKFIAISEIATITSINIGLYRRLLENNYLLKYNRFCINKEGVLLLKFDSFMSDASPKKIYNALRELSIISDKQDNLLIDEFNELSDTNTGLIIALPQHVVQIKIEYIRTEIAKVIEFVSTIKSHEENIINGISYLLLYCNYKIDFLTKPEGFIMEVIERNHRIFFANDKKGVEKKNRTIVKNLKTILERSDIQITEELYDTVHTFGVTKSSSHEQLKNLIETEIKKIQWYINAKENEMAEAVVGYIAGYALFYFGFPPPDVDMLTLLMRLLEGEYFKEIGFSGNLIKNNKPQEKIIVKKIKEISVKHTELFPEFHPNIKLLNYDNKLTFAYSFLRMISSYEIHYRGHIT